MRENRFTSPGSPIASGHRQVQLKTKSQDPPLSTKDGAAAGSFGLEIVEAFRARYKEACEVSAGWRQACRAYYETYAGDPWGETREAVEAEGRVVVNFNYAASTVNAVVGTDMSDRKEARFVSQSDSPRESLNAEARTNIVRYIYQREGGHRQESLAIFDQLVTGMGWMSAKVEDSTWPFRVRPSHVSCLSMYWDPDSKQPGLEDARWIVSQSRIGLQDMIARFPGKEAEIRELAGRRDSDDWQFIRTHFEDNYGAQSKRNTPQRRKGQSGALSTVLLWDYQWYEFEPHVVYDDPFTGEETIVPAAQYRATVEALEAEAAAMSLSLAEEAAEGGAPIPEPIDLGGIAFPRKVWYRAYLAGAPTGAILLADPIVIEWGEPTYQCATGYRFVGKDGRVSNFGLMALIYEPQRWVSKILSLIIDMLSRTSKQGGFFEEGAVPDMKSFLGSISKPGAWNQVSDGALAEGRIMERTATAWPAGFERLMEFARDAIPNVTAVTDWVKGTANTERSNVLISNLQQQSMTVLNAFFDSAAAMRMKTAKAIVELARAAYDDERLDRFAGRLQARDVTFLEQADPVTGMMAEIPIEDEYGPVTAGRIVAEDDQTDIDVVVDLAAATPSAKAALWQFFMQAAPPLADAGFPIQELFPIVAKSFPFIPETDLREISKSIKDQMDQQKMQGQLQAVMGEAANAPTEFIQQVDMALQQILAQREQEAMAMQQQQGDMGGEMPPGVQQ